MYPPSIAIFKSFTTLGDECYKVHCLNRPGCISHGMNITEAYTNIWDAIDLYDKTKEELCGV